MNVAVIGCGLLARGQHIPNIVASERMTLHTCCDVSDEALAICKEQFGALHITKDYREAITNPEVAMICLATHETFRRPVIELAAELGKPVYVEKPLADSPEELYKIEKIVKQSGMHLCVGHNRRSSPAMIEGQQVFRQHMDNPKPCPWRFDREGDKKPALAEDGTAAMSVRINDDWFSWKLVAFHKNVGECGPLLFEMTHFTDLCNFFLAAEPEEVVSLGHGILNHGVIIRYKTGEMATILMASNGTFGYPKELYEMFGSGAAVVVDHMLEVRTAGIEGAPAKKTYAMLKDRHENVGTQGGLDGWLEKKRTACDEAAARKDPSLSFTAEPDKGHARHLENFLDEVRSDGPAICGVDAAVSATRIAFAAIKSVQEKRVVKIDEI